MSDEWYQPETKYPAAQLRRRPPSDWISWAVIVVVGVLLICELLGLLPHPAPERPLLIAEVSR